MPTTSPPAAAGVNGFPVIIPASGDWITSQYLGGNTNGGNALNEQLYMPIFIPETATYNQIDITINTAVASAVVRLGIYLSDTKNKPGTLLVDCGTVDASTTGVKPITISQSLSQGLVWCSAVAQTGAAKFRAFSQQAMVGPAMPAGASNLVIQTPGSNSYHETGVTGALPNATPVFQGNVAGGGSIPIVGLVRA